MQSKFQNRVILPGHFITFVNIFSKVVRSHLVLISEVFLYKLSILDIFVPLEGIGLFKVYWCTTFVHKVPRLLKRNTIRIPFPGIAQHLPKPRY
jgi:hypothetical protein